MQQTLFYIPPVVLQGWLLVAWLIISAAILIRLYMRHGWSSELIGFLPVVIVVSAVLYFVLPNLAILGPDPTDPTRRISLGLAVRGYGVMMMLGMIAGTYLMIRRAKPAGIPIEKILTLTLVVVVTGLVGARLFYVIQKFEYFRDPSPLRSLAMMLDMTKGGLVVYGSLIGGAIGGAWYAWRHRLPIPLVADMAAPGMLVGLAFGRVGCLLNGCCFGGVTDTAPVTLEFPAGSPPYVRQLETGQLLGATTQPHREDAAWRVIQHVQPGSLADLHGLEPGQAIYVGFESEEILRLAKSGSNEIQSQVVVHLAEGHPRQIPLSELPDRSLPVHPTQVYAAINAALLAGVIWFFYPFRPFTGSAFCLLLLLYGVTRFLLEMIRVDEAGLFGTPFTISQWISMIGIGVGATIWILVSSTGTSKRRIQAST